MQPGRRRDKRRAIRIACTLPLRIRTRTGWLDARLVDLSRGGIRFALPAETVGVGAKASLLEIARRLGSLLPERIQATIGPEAQVQRDLRVVRIGKVTSTPPEVELGCLHDRPLEDADALALEIVLPREGESWEQAERRLDVLRPDPSDARR